MKCTPCAVQKFYYTVLYNYWLYNYLCFTHVYNSSAHGAYIPCIGEDNQCYYYAIALLISSETIKLFLVLSSLNCKCNTKMCVFMLNNSESVFNRHTLSTDKLPDHDRTVPVMSVDKV